MLQESISTRLSRAVPRRFCCIRRICRVSISLLYTILCRKIRVTRKRSRGYIYRQLRASEPPDEATARDVIRALLLGQALRPGRCRPLSDQQKLDLDIDPAIRTLTREDIIAIIKSPDPAHQLESQGVVDIDHLSNVVVRTVGEQLSNQFSVGFTCAWRVPSASV